ncbi:MAG TPA: M20/M25/M40 family metallo-hydrolase [Gemmatimonadales bacterium]|nr:M20/M25/M40 family metallo-hydrolase [Gemmatimonadales bacterium]
MPDISLGFLADLLDAPGPSGFEAAPARRWRAEAERFATSVRVDVNGNSFATVGGTASPAPQPVMFAGHVDEIGLSVIHIDDQGFLWFDPIGGWDPEVFVGQRVTLLGREGPVAGVIGRPAIHLLEKEVREKVIKPSDLWIDIGASSRAEAAARVRVGDAGVLAAGRVELPRGRLVSRSLDNRIGAFVVLEALRDLARAPAAAPVVAVATAQEEISHTGGGARTSATDLAPLVAIVVDVTHATDTPGVEAKKHGEVKLGGGPVLSRGSAVNPRVFDALVDTAEAEGIPYALQAAPRHTGTDADSIFTAHRGVATGLVSVPLRYMHSPNELVALEDLERAARLLAAFARRVTPGASFLSL